jgi:hypothetical protein
MQRHQRTKNHDRVVTLRPFWDKVGVLREPRTEGLNRVREAAGALPILRFEPGTLSDQDWSARRLNFLAGQFPSWSRYLEIGIALGRTLENVRVRTRVGVDPAPRFDLSMLPRRMTVEVQTSDAYFQGSGATATFDVAFVDGLHTVEQTYRDVLNTFARVLGGPVLIDDTVPSDEISALPDQEASMLARRSAGLGGTQWHGDVWRVVVVLHRHHPELEWRTIIDAGNPQTLVWRRTAGAPVSSATPAQLADIMNLAYGDVFAKGTPDYFAPTTETQALLDCVNALR